MLKILITLGQRRNVVRTVKLLQKELTTAVKFVVIQKMLPITDLVVPEINITQMGIVVKLEKFGWKILPILDIATPFKTNYHLQKIAL